MSEGTIYRRNQYLSATEKVEFQAIYFFFVQTFKRRKIPGLCVEALPTPASHLPWPPGPGGRMSGSRPCLTIGQVSETVTTWTERPVLLRPGPGQSMAHTVYPAVFHRPPRESCPQRPVTMSFLATENCHIPLCPEHGAPETIRDK